MSPAGAPLRQSSAARCFLMRAIETMEQSEDQSDDADRGYDHVPEGQIKIRVRIAPSGEVVRTEVLETGFVDEQSATNFINCVWDRVDPDDRAGCSIEANLSCGAPGL